jgi:hypothetical protein
VDPLSGIVLLVRESKSPDRENDMSENIIKAIAELGKKLAATSDEREIAAYSAAIEALSNSIQR